jgi:hypothetical protein
MIEMRRFGWLDAILFLVILAGAAGVRVAYLMNHCRQGSADGPWQVQDAWPKSERDKMISHLKEGHGFLAQAPLADKEELTADQTIAYPGLVSLLDPTWVGLAADQTDQLVRWIQCGLGTLAAGFYFLIARRAFHSLPVGTLAGLLCAIHPYWVINTAEINDGVLTTFVFALCLFLGVRAGQTGGPLSSLLFGLGLAALACIRASLLPFGVAAILWFLWRTRTLPRGWLAAVLAFLGFVNGLIPWMARNYQNFGNVFPIVDSAYWHLWVGNNAKATGGPLTDNMLQTLNDRKDEFKNMAQADRYAKLAPLVTDEIVDHPAETLQRRLESGVGFFLGHRWLEDRSLVQTLAEPSAEATDWLSQAMPVLLPGALVAMLVLGLLGWRWSYGWRQAAMPSSLAVMWVTLPYLLSHAEALHGARLPLDGVLLSYVALAIVFLLPGVGQSIRRGEEPHPE